MKPAPLAHNEAHAALFKTRIALYQKGKTGQYAIELAYHNHGYFIIAIPYNFMAAGPESSHYSSFSTVGFFCDEDGIKDSIETPEIRLMTAGNHWEW